MKKFTIKVLLILAIAFMASAPVLNSQVPRMLNYQGNLFDKNGQALNGTLPATFKLFDIPSGGTEIWSETHSLKIDSGYFSIYLGSKNPFDNILFDIQYFVEVSINNQAPYGRVPLITSPYAFRSIYTDTSNVAKIAINVIDGSITLNSLANSVKNLGGDLIGTLPNPKIKPSAILGAIPDHSITIDKLSYNLTFPPAGPANGDLTGTYPDPIIAEGAVKTDRIFDEAVNSQKIRNGTVAYIDMNLDALSGSIPYKAVTAITGNFKDVFSTNVTTGVSSSSISVNSPLGNLTTVNSSFANITNSNVQTEIVGTSTATISFNAPLANLTTVNSTNTNSSNGNIGSLISGVFSATTSITTPQANIGNANLNSLTTGTASATTSITTPQANIGNANLNSLVTGTASATTSITTPQANIGNANLNSLTAGTASATTSISTPQANIGNANLNSLTAGTASATVSLNAPQINGTNANINTLIAGISTSTISLNSPQINGTNANINTLTLGTITSTVTNASGINASGSITSNQGLLVIGGGSNILGNSVFDNGTFIVNSASSTFKGLLELTNTQTNNGQVVTNNIVTNNSDVLNKGNTIIGDAGSDNLTINASATFNQVPRFNVGLNSINANINTLVTGTTSSTTSITSPLANLTNAFMDSESSNNLTTGIGSATISFTSPIVNTTDLYVRTIHESTPLAVSNANFTSSVNAPTVNATTGTIATLNFTTATGTTSLSAPNITSSVLISAKDITSSGITTLKDLVINGSMSTSGTLTSANGLTVSNGGANITGNLSVGTGTLTAAKGIKITTGGLYINAGSLTITDNYFSNSGSITLTNGGILANSASFNTLSIGNIPYLAATSSSFGSSTIGGTNRGLYVNATLVGSSEALTASISGTTALKVFDDGTTGRIVNVNGGLTLACNNTFGSDALLTDVASIRNYSIVVITTSTATARALPNLTANENGRTLRIINPNALNVIVTIVGSNVTIPIGTGSSFIYIHGTGWFVIK